MHSVGLAGIAAVARILDWSLAPKGILKIGELEPGRVATPAVQIDHALQEAEDIPNHIKPTPTRNMSYNTTIKKGLDPTSTAAGIVKNPPSTGNPLVRGFLDASELICAMRGIGWAFGTGTRVYVAHDWRNTANRGVFARQTFVMLLLKFLITDMGESVLKMVPGVGDPLGGSIFAFGKNAFEKYTISTALNFITGLCIMTGNA